MTEPRPIRAGPSHEAAVMGLHPPCPLIDVEGGEDNHLCLHLSDEEINVLTVDQREVEEDFDEKQLPLLQGLISRATAALRVDMPPDQGPAPSHFDDEMGGFQPLPQFLVPLLSDCEDVVRKQFKVPHTLPRCPTALSNHSPTTPLPLVRPVRQKSCIETRHFDLLPQYSTVACTFCACARCNKPVELVL